MKKYLLLSMVAVSTLPFVGCSSDNESRAKASEISFSEAKVPTTDLEKRSIFSI